MSEDVSVVHENVGGVLIVPKLDGDVPVVRKLVGPVPVVFELECLVEVRTRVS